MTPEQHLELVQRLVRIEENTKEIPEIKKRISALEESRTKAIAWASGAGAVAAGMAKYLLPCVLALVFTQGVLPTKAYAELPRVQTTEGPCR